MKRIAIYPGSFDPFTNGHVDIAKRALAMFDELYIGVANNSRKRTLFDTTERILMIEEITKDWGSVFVESFDGLTVDYANSKNACAIVRGLRAVTDFDYEFAISIMNKKLAPDVETVFLMASPENSFISSTIVKEVARHGRDVTGQVHAFVNKKLSEKLDDTL